MDVPPSVWRQFDDDTSSHERRRKANSWMWLTEFFCLRFFFLRQARNKTRRDGKHVDGRARADNLASVGWLCIGRKREKINKYLIGFMQKKQKRKVVAMSDISLLTESAEVNYAHNSRRDSSDYEFWFVGQRRSDNQVNGHHDESSWRANEDLWKDK